jgi:competence protein ComEC
MVAGLVGAVARSRGWSRRRRTVATLAVVALYVVLSGAGAAALRSSLMVGAGLLLSRDGRRPALLRAARALRCAAAVHRTSGGDGRWIPALVSRNRGILLLASPIAVRIPGPRVLVEPFAVTVAAQLATAPVTAGTFGVLSLVGPFANALVLPLLPVDIVVGGAGAMAATPSPALGWLPLEVAGLVSRIVLAVAQGMASLPMAAIPVQLWPSEWTFAELAAVGAAAGAWCLHTRARPGAGGAAALAVTAAVIAGAASTYIAAAATDRALRVTVLSVGNGVAVLIRPPGGGTVLVDGGSDGAALLTALGRALSPLDRHIDAVVLTATDHATSAAIPGLIGHYDLGSLVVSQPLPPALQTAAASLAGTGTRVVVAAGAAPWTLGGVTARCIPSGPAESAPCVLELSDGPSTAVVTGNLAQAAQDELAGVWTSELRCDLLVGPTTTAPSAALLAVARPSLVAVPAARTPPGLGATGLDISVTGRDGDLDYDALAAGGFTSASG